MKESSRFGREWLGVKKGTSRACVAAMIEIVATRMTFAKRNILLASPEREGACSMLTQTIQAPHAIEIKMNGGGWRFQPPPNLSPKADKPVVKARMKLKSPTLTQNCQTSRGNKPTDEISLHTPPQQEH